MAPKSGSVWGPLVGALLTLGNDSFFSRALTGAFSSFRTPALLDPGGQDAARSFASLWIAAFSFSALCLAAFLSLVFGFFTFACAGHFFGSYKIFLIIQDRPAAVVTAIAHCCIRLTGRNAISTPRVKILT